jgi:REP element-mobilizing transposase RayT
MSEPIAYHITWRTHGSWLPGDSRGWVKHNILGIQEASPSLETHARSLMKHEATSLTQVQRDIVDATIREHCRIRKWVLHAVNVRSNHVHLVVSADIHPDRIMAQLKAWCSRRLNEATQSPPDHWWAGHGSTKWINDEQYLEDAIRYVLEVQ